MNNASTQIPFTLFVAIFFFLFSLAGLAYTALAAYVRTYPFPFLSLYRRGPAPHLRRSMSPEDRLSAGVTEGQLPARRVPPALLVRRPGGLHPLLVTLPIFDPNIAAVPYVLGASIHTPRRL